MSYFLVHYRIFALTPHMEPVERNNKTLVDASISIDIVVLYFSFYVAFWYLISFVDISLLVMSYASKILKIRMTSTSHIHRKILFIR